MTMTIVWFGNGHGTYAQFVSPRKSPLCKQSHTEASTYLAMRFLLHCAFCPGQSFSPFQRDNDPAQLRTFPYHRTSLMFRHSTFSESVRSQDTPNGSVSFSFPWGEYLPSTEPLIRSCTLTTRLGCLGGVPRVITTYYMYPLDVNKIVTVCLGFVLCAMISAN